LPKKTLFRNLQDRADKFLMISCFEEKIEKRSSKFSSNSIGTKKGIGKKRGQDPSSKNFFYRCIRPNQKIRVGKAFG